MDYLNTALADFINAVQGLWAPVFQQEGINALLAIGALAFCVYAINLAATHDIPTFIMGFAYTILSLAVLHAVFLTSQYLATDVYNGFLQWAQLTSGMSPNVLTPSGVSATGWQVAKIFWAAGGHASWWNAPMSAAEDLICTFIIELAFNVAGLILLIVQTEVWVLIIGASVLLAFAALPWTWEMFPGWALTVLSYCVKMFFLLCVLALGLVEANGWATNMGARGGAVVANIQLMFLGAFESLLFVFLVWAIPTLMAWMIRGAAVSAGSRIGEGILAGIAAEGGSKAAAAALAAATPGAPAAAAQAAKQAIFSMMMR